VNEKVKKKIVVACRGGSFRDILSMELEKSGFEVFPVGDGSTALEATLFRHPEVLIVDSPLDVISRDTLVQILRANPLTKDTHIIALCREEKDVPGLTQIIDVSLKKPLKTADIISRVSAIFHEEGEATEDLKDSEPVKDPRPRKIPHLELVRGKPESADDAGELSFDDFIDSGRKKESTPEEISDDPGHVEITPVHFFEEEETLDPAAASFLEDDVDEIKEVPFKIFPGETSTPLTSKGDKSSRDPGREPEYLDTPHDEKGFPSTPDSYRSEPAELEITADAEPSRDVRPEEYTAKHKPELSVSAIEKEEEEEREELKEEPEEKPARVAPVSALTTKTLDLKMEKEMIDLYQHIETLLPKLGGKVIQFIGSREGEGTSTITREFAKVMAIKSGKAVLLMDADFLAPSQHFYFDVEPALSLEEVIRNGKSLQSALSQVGNTHLYLNLISKNKVSTLKILHSARIDSFFDVLRKRYDLILIDSPPATVSPESLGLSSRVDGVILVVDAEATRWMVAESVKDKIAKNGGNLLGVVLNKKRYHIPDFIYKRLK
jgi:Mrp family chromosome partitioning ATPase/DNA-binding response OmpR family regulator